MKILLVSQYFWPESFRINDLADELVKRNHEVTVLTGKPNYPEGKIAKGYKWWGFQKEKRNGVQIVRVPLIARGNGSGGRLALNYLSYVFFSCLFILFHGKKYDASLTFAISPITQVYAALLHKWMFKSKAYIWIQDLWPESVSAAGKMENGFIMRLLTSMVKDIYKKADGILVQSEAFIPSINRLGNYSEKVYYIPNWAEDIFLDREAIDKSKYTLPNGFKVMFAGNIGEAQDFDSIIKAVEYTKEHEEIKWIIVGDGRKRKEIEEIAKKKKLNNIIFMGRYPLAEMPALFVHSDVTLVTLKDQMIFSLTIPSKVQSYMAFGKPIVTMINGIGNEIVKEAHCGFTASAGDYKALAENVIKMSKLSKEELRELGDKAMSYYSDRFAKEQIISSLIEIFKK